MRVLISAPSLKSTVNVSGVATVVKELTQALGQEVDYINLQLGAPQTGSFLRRKSAAIANAIRAAFKVALTRALVLHANTALMPRSIVRDLPVVLIAKLTGKRVLVHVHGGVFVATRAEGFVGLCLRSLLRLADVVVFLSETEKRQFLGHTPISTARVVSIYNSIRLPPRPDRTRLSGPLRVIFAGRLVPEKGIHVILQAAAACDPESVTFTLFGEGPLGKAVENTANLQAGTRYGGVFEHGEWPQILRNYDVLALPSTDPFEGMPMIILEAMSIGLVPVATPFGSIPELLGRNERGLLVEPGDAEQFQMAVRRLQSDPELLANLSASAVEFARHHFNISEVSKNFFALYSELASVDSFEATAKRPVGT